MIKVNHECPKCLLSMSGLWNDYEFILPHLLDEDEEYRDYFLKAKAEGAYIVMDNSLHELGEAYDHKRLLHWVKELEPDEFIVPDVWENTDKTLVNAKHFLQYDYPKNTTLVAVVQGNTRYEMIRCYELLKQLGYKKIAFSYGTDVYNKIFPHPNKFMGKALGRLTLITLMYEDGIISKSDRIHLLGTSLPQEFAWYKDMPFIESLDTSNPIMAALDGEAYTEMGLHSKPQSNLNNSFNIKEEQINLDLVGYNTDMFKIINGLK